MEGREGEGRESRPATRQVEGGQAGVSVAREKVSKATQSTEGAGGFFSTGPGRSNACLSVVGRVIIWV